MFDEGFTNYMSKAFPKDNLLPISCTGADWQGGMAVTLLDSLDSLMVSQPATRAPRFPIERCQ